ncbi:unnamed protein product [Closterium sp. NIES-64]|nr:unnamed protein product [Closterium sp. NIES-64]
MADPQGGSTSGRLKLFTRRPKKARETAGGEEGSNALRPELPRTSPRAPPPGASSPSSPPPHLRQRPYPGKGPGPRELPLGQQLGELPAPPCSTACEERSVSCSRSTSCWEATCSSSSAPKRTSEMQSWDMEAMVGPAGVTVTGDGADDGAGEGSGVTGLAFTGGQVSKIDLDGQLEVLKWILDVKRKEQVGVTREERRRIDEQKRLLKDYIKAKKHLPLDL